MSSVVDWLKDIAEGIIQIPIKIGEFFKDLGTTILDGIKAIFIPDKDDISANFNAFVNEMKMKFGFNTEVFNTLFDGEMAVQDQYADYNISGVGTFKFKFLDTKFLYEGVSYFRPLIRGFLVLLMAFYNIKMILSFIRQDAGVVTGKAVEMEKGGK